MAKELLRNAVEAFNEGRIEANAFVFPLRTVDSRGPMIWNKQILDYAGYKMDDGTVLGDPANVDLTTAITELGWAPPQNWGRWDLLPHVTMAEGDKPAMMEIPAPLSNLVNISHPQFPSFAALKLKWKAAPALTRLGFDIGGVQYTAAPFIGWFMDAEIGVRDLADTFRYNALPDIVRAIGLANGKLQDGVDSIEDLPEYEQLAMLSRAQSELNYAVQWSFSQAGVTMTDSLMASKKWCKVNDELKEKHGYRLPADPYWLAPPQGSIIPVWHRGGAPNYQPKPMISKHVQDPVKAWRRERHMWQLVSEPPKLMTFSQTEAAFPRLVDRKMAAITVTEIEDSSDDDSDAISLKSTLSEQKTIVIYFCSAGTIAEKLAKRLHKRIEALVKVSLNVALQPRVECLNKLNVTDMTADKISWLVVSSTGKGEVPPNGSGFLRHTRLSSIEGMSFSVFGNGDSRYSATYNGAAKAVHQHMQNLGGRPLIRKVFREDIAVEPIPYTAVNNWWNSLESRLYDLINKDEAIFVDYGSKLKALNETITVVNDAVDRLIDHGKDLSFFKDAFAVAAQPVKPELSIDIGSAPYEDQNCIQMLPMNHPSKVDRALKVLKLDGAATLDLPTHEDNPTYGTFLTNSLISKIAHNLTVLETLELLAKTNLLSRFITKPSLVQDIILSIPLLHTRTYSVASSLSAKPRSSSAPDANTVDIMIKRIPNGRFSSTFLIDHSTSPAKLQYRIVDYVTGPRLRHLSAQTDKPLVIVATGAGFGPVKCLLQSRIAAARCAKSATPAFEKMSLFLGFHPTNIPLVKPISDDAEELGLIDELHIMESNPEKRRVQDLLVRYDMAGKLREKLIGEKEGWVFVCASEGAAEGTKGAFQRILGMDGNEKLCAKRYLEEVF